MESPDRVVIVRRRQSCESENAMIQEGVEFDALTKVTAEASDKSDTEMHFGKNGWILKRVDGIPSPRFHV